MRRVLAGIFALLFLGIAVALLFGMIEVSDLPRCEDREAVLASDEDECIEGSPARKAIGLIVGYGTVLVAALAAWFGFIYASGRERRGFAMAICAIATPVLALLTLLLLPFSF